MIALFALFGIIMFIMEGFISNINFAEKEWQRGFYFGSILVTVLTVVCIVCMAITAARIVETGL